MSNVIARVYYSVGQGELRQLGSVGLTVGADPAAEHLKIVDLLRSIADTYRDGLFDLGEPT